MAINKNKINTKASSLYNNILLLSRNKLFYTKFNLADTFENRIHLIFVHISFLFIKINQNMKNVKYKTFSQKLFDFLFKQIELNMREIGHGDVLVNKNMKFLVKSFYNILLFCEKYEKKTTESKELFFSKNLVHNIQQKMTNNLPLINYFNEFQAFCFDLSSDSVLKGELNFNYK